MSQFHTLKISNIRRETVDCISIAFHLPTDLKAVFDFQSGQYLTLRTHVGGEELRRSYSICSSPVENELRIAVKKVEEGKFSTFANQQLRVGDSLDVMPPMGNFKLPSNATDGQHYVFFAAGSGITPIVSMLKTILKTQPSSRCTLIYGNQNAANVIFREEIEGLKNKNLGRLSIFHVISRERSDTELGTGRIDADKMAQFFKKMPDILGGGHFFICGPYEMTETVRKMLSEKNIEPHKIYFELFGAPNVEGFKKRKSITDDENGTKKRVSIQIDGLVFDVFVPEGVNILDAAQAKGADLPFACKGGVCCTCRAKLTAGTMEMDVNYALTEEETDAGFILTCQAVPTSDHCFVNFDEK